MSELTRIVTAAELDSLWKESSRHPVFLLKHSTRCGASAAARRDFRNFAVTHADADVGWAVVEIPECRELSDEIARRTGVPHESPQILRLQGGRVTWHASHWRISREALARALEVGPAV